MSAKALESVSQTVRGSIPHYTSIAEKRAAERERRIARFAICALAFGCMCAAAALYPLYG